MPLAALLSVALVLSASNAAVPASPPPVVMDRAADASKLSAAWERDVLVLTGIEPGASLRVYDVVGRVLADFRAQSPSVRLQLPRRQLVAVCAEGDCVGAR